MTLSTSEVESLRFHLGWGNVGIGAKPYTPDGFYEVFNNVVKPYLASDTETTSTTAVTAAGVTTLTLGSVTNISTYTRLVIDTGEDVEVVEARAVSGSTVTAKFALTHAQPFPVAILSGVMRLRLLLFAADRAWRKEHSSSITAAAGIKQLGKGEIEYFPGGMLLADVSGQYMTIQERISSLVQVPINKAASGKRRASGIEPY